MRVLVLTHSYTPEHSPPQRRWTQFVRIFRAAGWDVDVIAPIAHAPHGRRKLPRDEAGRPFKARRGEFGESVRTVPYLWHRTTRRGRLLNHLTSAVCSIPAALMGARPDVVVVTVPSLPILGAGYVVSRILRRPLVVDMRDAWPDLAWESRVVRDGGRSSVGRVITAIQRRAALVVTVTSGFARTLTGVDTSRIQFLDPPATERDRLEVLYLGNLGESQRLGVPIRAAALVGDRMRLTIVGSGVRQKRLERLARELGAPVEFRPPNHGKEIFRLYADADSCIVSLRDDWKSFETTIPSKTYEVLSVGRHVTGIVLGEAKSILEEAGAGHVVRADPQELADLWSMLASDRSLLRIGRTGRNWVERNADVEVLGREYLRHLERVVEESRR